MLTLLLMPPQKIVLVIVRLGLKQTRLLKVLSRFYLSQKTEYVYVIQNLNTNMIMMLLIEWN